MAWESSSWEITPARRDPRVILHLSMAAGTLAAPPATLLGLAPAAGFTPPAWFYGMQAGIGLLGIFWALLALRLWPRRIAQTVTVGREAVTIEGSPASPVCVRRVPYDRIQALGPSPGWTLGLTLWVSGMSLPVVIGGRGTDPQVLEVVAEEIRGRIGKLPDGAERLARIEAKARFGSALVGRVPIVTLATGLVLLASVLVQWMAASLPFPADADVPAVALANVPDRVAAGEVYRLVTANFLHLNALHFAGNLLGIAVGGYLVELAIGGKRTVLLLAVSGIVAHAAAAAWGGFDVVIGASGLIYGCLGALLWLRLRRGDELPGRLSLPHITWILIGFGLIAEIGFPGISAAGHLGGLLAGLLLTPVLVGRRSLADLVGARS